MAERKLSKFKRSRPREGNTGIERQDLKLAFRKLVSLVELLRIAFFNL